MALPLIADLAVGFALLTAGLALGLRMGRRMPASALEWERRQVRAIDEVVLAVSHGRHVDEVLERLVREACEIMAVEKSVVVMRDDKDPRSSVVVAAHGVPEDFLGHHFGIDEGMFGAVMLSGEPQLVTDYRAFPRALGHAAARDIRAGGAVPIRLGGAVKAALVAATTSPGRGFRLADLDTLARLAELGTVALEQAAIREQLEIAVDSGVEAMAAAVDMRDSYTAEHSDEVVALARVVGRRLGLDESALDELTFAARLHDVGKIGVPDAVLQKPGPLDSNEWDVMRQHPVWGSEMLKRIPGLRSVAKVVRHGHERWDGNGYPDGLKHEEIPFGSRIVFACDAYHAMTSERPYRQALQPWIAVSQLREGAGCQFDPDVVEAVVRTLRERSGSSLRLFGAVGSAASS